MALVAIAGSGAVAFTCACHLVSIGHQAMVWAPSGNGTAGMGNEVKITSRGHLNGEFCVQVAHSPETLAAASDLILVAVPAFGQKSVIDTLLPQLRNGQTVVLMSAQMSLSALYLARAVAASGKRIRVAGLHGPMTRGRRISATEYAQVAPNRRSFIAAVPAADTTAVIETMQDIFGNYFHAAPHGLEVAFNGIAGVFHSALALANLTRMESREEWCGYRHTTDSVGNLAEALDAERVAVARSLDIGVPDLLTYIGAPAKGRTVPEIFQPLAYEEYTRNGPREIEHRYIEEEIPFNLVTIEMLGTKTGVATPLISNLITLFGALRKRDYRQRNTMAASLDVAGLTAPELIALYRDGFSHTA